MRNTLPILLLALCLCPAAVAADDAPKAPLYAEVHAIFAKNCLSCHDSKEADGELVLETHELLMKGGETGPAIVPGKSGDSLLVKLIEHADKPFMPPPKKGAKLSDAEIAVVRGWIDAGALPGEVGPAPTVPVILPKIVARTAPKPSVNALAAAPSAANVYAVGLPGAVELRSLDTRALVRRFEGLAGTVNDLAFSADGATLAAASGEPGASGQVNLWNVADGRLVRTINGHDDALYAVAISPNGAILATGSYDQQIRLWELATGKPLLTLAGHNGCVFDLAFRPDGRVLASASADRTVKLWDVATGARLDTLSESLKELHAVAFAPAGDRVLAAGADNRIRNWLVSSEAQEGTNRLLQSVFAHEGQILRLAFSPDGKTLASSADNGTVKLWNAADLSIRHALPQQPDWPTALSLTDALLLVGRLDGTVEAYDANTGAAVPAPPPPKPELALADPPGVQRGATTRVRLTGKHLAEVTAVTSPAAEVRLALAPDPKQSDALWVTVTVPQTPAPPEAMLHVASAGGESNPVRLFIDDLPQSSEQEPNDDPARATALPATPAAVWGRLGAQGDADHFAFDARAGQTLVLDLAGQRVGGKLDAVLTLADAAGNVIASVNDFDLNPDPLLAFTPPADGRYVVKVHDLQIAGSPEHLYRLSVGAFPLVTGVFPLGVPANAETKLRLVGYNLPPDASVMAKSAGEGELAVPLGPALYRTRRPLSVLVAPAPTVLEAEPNDRPEQATPLPAPGIADGRVMPASPEAGAAPDADLYRFDAKQGQTWIIECVAARRGSPADTKVEVLHAPDGRPVPRLLLRAVRDSYIEFRPIGPDDGGGRLKNWEEMELNEYVYFQGEVVKLFLAPRGPDSQWDFYTLNGRRRCYFDTSAAAHALDETCFVVEPLPPGSAPAPNGLPVFPLNYANDDDAERKLGADSRLTFTAPADGSYLVRVTDTRGGGSDRHAYRLVLRAATPDFNVSLAADAPAVPPGTGVGFTVRADRLDNFDDDVRVDVTDLPPGFVATTPIVIQAGHVEARGTLFALPDAPPPADANAAASKLTATATVNGRPVTKPVNNFGKLALGGTPPLVVSMEVTEDGQRPADGSPPELTIAPGQEISAWLTVTRGDHKDLVEFDIQNLPHGIIVSDIGLNGVLIPKDETKRQVFIACAPWVPDQSRLVFARARQAGSPTSKPVLLHVRRPVQQASGK
jgi:WD40 repeat protein